MTTQYFSHKERYAVVNILTAIMEADTIIHPQEIEYMDSVLADFAITEDDNERLELMDLQMCFEIIKGMSAENLEKAKEMFVTMAVIDGYFDPREKQLLEML